MLADIIEIELQDGGDGSTHVILKFENENEHTISASIPFEGRVVFTENDDFNEGVYYDETGAET